jgi:hypothetical protein
MAVHREFDQARPGASCPAIVEHRREIDAELQGCRALLIAGGHVHILLNRMRLFGLAERIADKAVIAWSAGAMAMSDRIVLFHDSPPQGAGHAEISDIGLGLISGIVPLPHAGVRLRLNDIERVSIFAQRFAPAVCATLDPGAMLVWLEGALTHSAASLRLLRSGALRPMSPP